VCLAPKRGNEEQEQSIDRRDSATRVANGAEKKKQIVRELVCSRLSIPLFEEDEINVPCASEQRNREKTQKKRVRSSAVCLKSIG
jgi:hypothetical protein